MTNRTSSKQHGLVGNFRPKSKLSKRRNKANARARAAARRAEGGPSEGSIVKT